MAVFLVLGAIWALVLVPPAVRAHLARKEAFLVSFGNREPSPETAGPAPTRSQSVQRRRRIAGGLLLAMAATFLAGLLPTFRPLLVVHLFLVDSFLAYIALLAHAANRASRDRRAARHPDRDEVTTKVPPAAAARRWRRGVAPEHATPAALRTVIPLG